MRRLTRATREFYDQAGILSTSHGVTVAVYFDLVELQDFIDGVADRKFSYGNLRFNAHVESDLSEFLSSSRLTLTGGGIEAELCLYTPRSFTVFGAITEICASREGIAA